MTIYDVMNIVVPLVCWSFLGFVIFNIAIDLSTLFWKKWYDKNYAKYIPYVFVGRVGVVIALGPFVWIQLLLEYLGPSIIIICYSVYSRCKQKASNPV